ncbi:MAG: TIM-barrel domain-containing protein [Planctomycetota bacterium]
MKTTRRHNNTFNTIALVTLAGLAVGCTNSKATNTDSSSTDTELRTAAPTLLRAPAVQQGVIVEQIGDGITQFHASANARDNRLPSFALEASAEVLATIPADDTQNLPTRPVFSTDDRGRFITTIAIEPGTTLYGTGQVGGELRRNGRVTEAWNRDAYLYQDHDKNLYTAHPWVLAVREDGTSFGVLADTTYRTEIDLRGGITFRADGREHPVIIIERDHPKDVVAALGELTGTIEMPPRWAVGYHQCRYSYFPDDRVMEVATNFRDRNIPADVIWMDIDYMHGFRSFTFDPELFPDPASLNSDLRALGFANVWMINPGIKNEDGYFVHDQGNDIDAWVKRADGTEYQGDVWPGEVVFPDYTMKNVREWWAGLYADYMATGIDGVWNDMNEPTTFIRDEEGGIAGAETFPEDNLHRADEELGGHGPHARYHNVYGMLMVKASREGIMDANPGKRPFVLSRANYLGGHRYGATWTGDNTANWPHVDYSIPMTLNLGLSGQPFVGPDLGGFIGDGTPEMFSRWMGFGALMPFARGHTEKGTRDKEPWSYGPEIEATVRRALERRYRLMPLFYSLFEEAHRTGVPVARPLFFADPVAPELRDVDDAFMLGDNLIVHADVKLDRTGALVLPENNTWHEIDFASFDGGRDSKDPDQPKLFVREGGIVPTGPVHEHFGDRPDQRDELELIIALDERGEASGELYEDAGEGWGFREGDYLRTRYTARRVSDTLLIETQTLSGQQTRPNRTLKARIILGNGREIQGVGIDGITLTVPLNAETAHVND